MRRILAAIGALSLTAVAACGGSGEGGGAAGGDGTVTVAHVPTTLFAPLYVAQAKGYFSDEGVDVQLETMQAGQDAVPLASSGQVDAVVAGFSAGLFNAIDKGLNISVVGSMGLSTGDPDASPTALEVAKDLVDSGEIESVADLEGRKVALSGGNGAAGGYQMDVILRQAGLTLNDIEPVNLSFPDMESAVANDSVAAALPPAPFTTAMEESGTTAPLAVPPEGTVATGVIYGEQFAGTDNAQPFFSAMARASKDLQGDSAKSEEHLNILAEATEQDLATLEEVPFYTWGPNLAPRTEQIQAMQRTYLDAGLLDYDEPIAIGSFVNTEFSEQAEAEAEREEGS